MDGLVWDVQVIMESRSELLQTQDQNPRHAEYNAAWKANSSSLASQKLRTTSAPDGLRSMLTAMQGAGSDGSATSQGEEPSLSEARQESSLSPDTESSPTVASARNTGPSTMSAGFPGSAASSVDGVRERAEAVMRDAESVLKQEPSWAADAASPASRPGGQPGQPIREIRPSSDSYGQELRPRGTSITHDDFRMYGQDAGNGHPIASDLAPAPGQERLLGQSSFDSPQQSPPTVNGLSIHAAKLQHRSPDAARGVRDSPSGVTYPISLPTGNYLVSLPHHNASINA